MHITRHAEQSMRERNIGPATVAAVVRSGRIVDAREDLGAVRLALEGFMVVMSVPGWSVITTYEDGEHRRQA